jgi:transcriptional regulator with XRE-family HTH domain
MFILMGGIMELDNEVVLMRSTRVSLGLTQEQAGRLVGVTKRAWEHWEAGTRKVPTAAFELFIAKASGALNFNIEPREGCRLVVIVSDDGNTPIDVVSRDNFFDIELSASNEFGIVSSLMIDRFTGKRSKRSTKFLVSANPGIVRTAKIWEKDLDDTDAAHTHATISHG